MGQYTSYYLYQKFEKRGTQDWIPVYQNVYSINGDGTQPTVVKNQNDEECGYEPIVEPIYRWIEVTPTSDPSTYICDECEIDYSKQYLTFVPIESATTFSFNSNTENNISYSLDGGSTWSTLVSGTPSPSVVVGQKIMWKGNLSPRPSQWKGIGSFSSTGKFDVEGNVMSLVSGDSFSAATTATLYLFSGLFRNCTGLTSAEKLILPRICGEYCFISMFAGCTSLISAPDLSSSSPTAGCYSYMFYGCTSLTTAPVINDLGNGTSEFEDCALCMFYGCSSLNYIKCLAVSTLDMTHTTPNWVNGVAANGTFVKASGMSGWTTGVSGIPSNWTVNNYNG